MDADFEDGIDMLRSYCLVGMSGGDDMFEMHRLVQFSMKKWLEQHGELVGWQERYVDTMHEAFPSGQCENWSKCQALFPHAEAMLDEGVGIELILGVVHDSGPSTVGRRESDRMALLLWRGSVDFPFLFAK